MKLLVSDYDGTLDNNYHNLLLNIEAIKEFMNNGNKFVLSSGRDFRKLKMVTDKYNIPYDYLSTCDGTYLFDSNDDLVYRHMINRSILNKTSKLQKLDGIDYIEYSYPRSHSRDLIKGENLGGITFVIEKENIPRNVLNEFNRLKKENHKDYEFFIYNTFKNFLVIRVKGISKSTPVSYLRKKLDIDYDNIYTIGNDLNDFPMIRDYNGYIVGNRVELENIALNRYNAVYELVNDIEKQKVKRR